MMNKTQKSEETLSDNEQNILDFGATRVSADMCSCSVLIRPFVAARKQKIARTRRLLQRLHDHGSPLVSRRHGGGARPRGAGARPPALGRPAPDWFPSFVSQPLFSLVRNFWCKTQNLLCSFDTAPVKARLGSSDSDPNLTVHSSAPRSAHTNLVCCCWCRHRSSLARQAHRPVID